MAAVRTAVRVRAQERQPAERWQGWYRVVGSNAIVSEGLSLAVAEGANGPLLANCCSWLKSRVDAPVRTVVCLPW